MDNKIGPNGNRFKEINEEISEDENKEVEAEYEEEDLHDENLEEEIKKEEKLAKDQFRAKRLHSPTFLIIKKSFHLLFLRKLKFMTRY